MGDLMHMKRVFEDPDHPQYGPARRLWMMFEQLFADQGGLARVEARIALYQDQALIRRPIWDDHLVTLIRGGLHESDAQRTVLTQMFVAEQFTR